MVSPRSPLLPQHHDIVSHLAALMDLASLFVHEDLGNAVARGTEPPLALRCWGGQNRARGDGLYQLPRVLQGSAHVKPVLLAKLLRNVYL